MEKYYVIGTTVLSLALNIPVVALHEFGYVVYILVLVILQRKLFRRNEPDGICWYSNANEKTRLRWIIGTQSFWISLAATIEMICSTIVLLWVYRFQVNRIVINHTLY